MVPFVVAALAVATSLVYVVIAIYIVPRIHLDSAHPRVSLLFRAGAFAFFVGCGLTHAHIAAHVVASPESATLHEALFHVFQVVGGWTFVYTSGRHLEVSVVPKVTQLQREMERRLAREREERQIAEQASATKSAFLAHMSHEIRTPMNGVVGLTDALADTELSGEQSELVRMIRSSADVLLGVINDILDLSKIEAGALRIECVPMNITTLVDDTCGAFLPIAQAKGLDLRWQVDAALDRELGGDPLRVRQVLGNLVGNAVKFTADGAVTVHVSTDGDFAKFTVADTGSGIDASQLESIFEEFSQGDPSTSRRFGGTGLGLSIARHLAAAMGGTVGVESTLGIGSTFWFTIRLLEARADVVVDVPMGSTEEAEVSLPVERGNTILLVEDDGVSQFVSKRLLEKLGFSVVVASNGVEAVDLATSRAFDLVLMDCQMPELDGYEATRRLRAAEGGRGPRVPIVAMTAHSLASDRERCLEAGMDDYVAKPIRAGELETVLGRWLALTS